MTSDTLKAVIVSAYEAMQGINVWSSSLCGGGYSAQRMVDVVKETFESIKSEAGMHRIDRERSFGMWAGGFVR
jgi:hypothetical protein